MSNLWHWLFVFRIGIRAPEVQTSSSWNLLRRIVTLSIDTYACVMPLSSLHFLCFFFLPPKQNICSDYYCMACQRYVEGVEPVTWNELTKFCKDCDKLQEIFANVVADIAASDKSNPIEWLHALTTTVSFWHLKLLTVLFRTLLIIDNYWLLFGNRWQDSNIHHFSSNELKKV